MNQSTSTMRNCDFYIANTLIEYLQEKGVPFSSDGYPIPSEKWFLETEPEEILPFTHRGACFDQKTTAICFNEPDKCLYVRTQKIFEEIEIYKGFLGVMPMDISVSRFMPIQVQKFNLLLNDLFLAVLGASGIKFAAPMRFGSIETVPHFRRYSKSTLWSIGCVGTLQNGIKSRQYEEYVRRAFVLVAGVPKRILSYGKMHEKEKRDWEDLGSSIREYADYNERSRRGDLSHVR